MKTMLKKLSALVVLLFALVACGNSTTENTSGELSGSLEPQPLASPVTLKVSIASPNETYSAVRLAN